MPYVSVHSPQFKHLVRYRIIKVRLGMNWTQGKMANALDISIDQYKKYEYRSSMPFNIMMLFCDVTSTSIEHMADRNATKEEMEYIKTCERQTSP